MLVSPVCRAKVAITATAFKDWLLTALSFPKLRTVALELTPPTVCASLMDSFGASIASQAIMLAPFASADTQSLQMGFLVSKVVENRAAAITFENLWIGCR